MAISLVYGVPAARTSIALLFVRVGIVARASATTFPSLPAFSPPFFIRGTFSASTSFLVFTMLLVAVITIFGALLSAFPAKGFGGLFPLGQWVPFVVAWRSELSTVAAGMFPCCELQTVGELSGTVVVVDVNRVVCR